MARISLRIIGLPKGSEGSEETSIVVDDILGIIQRIEYAYPRDYYRYIIFVNGIRLEEESIVLKDGDKVVVTPVMTGG